VTDALEEAEFAPCFDLGSGVGGATRATVER
jgi:hypothetical protein